MDYWKVIQRNLRQTATIYLHSSPNFVLETFLTVAIFLIYIYQHVEISRISRRVLRLRPHTIFCRVNKSGSPSRDSISTTVTHYKSKVYPSTTIAFKRLPTQGSSNSQIGWVIPTHPINDTLAGHQTNLAKKNYIDQLLALTPEQFVKIDKERKLREKELDNYMASLSTLCKNVVRKKYSSKTLTRQVEMVRENLECNKMSLEGKYLGFKTDAMTRSLFCLLEHVITNSSLQNPLPFKGDITSLALDVAELSRTRPTQDVDAWDITSSGCISDVTDDTANIDSFRDEDWEKDDSVKLDGILDKFL